MNGISQRNPPPPAPCWIVALCVAVAAAFWLALGASLLLPDAMK